MAYSPKYTSATDVYGKTGLSNTEVDVSANDSQLLQDAEAEVELITGRKFTGSNVATDYISGPDRDIIGSTGQKATRFKLTNWPIQSITAFVTLNPDGTTNTTYDNLTDVQISAGTIYTEDYWLETSVDPLTGNQGTNGNVLLTSDSLVPGRMNVRVSYTYGYSSVPRTVKTLATCIAGIMAWVKFMGGQYNRLDSYSIPQQSVSKGSFYDRANQNIEALTKEANELLDRIGRRPKTFYVSSTGAR